MIDILTIIYALVDDWHLIEGVKLLKGEFSAKPKFPDSEVITRILAQDLFPYPGEMQYIEFIRANYWSLFPKLIDQSQFNRRARTLRLLVEQLRRYWLVWKG
jgi:hypothetical protein